MEWYVLFESIIILFLLVLANSYLLALYCTSAEKGFGSTWFPKALVVLNQNEIFLVTHLMFSR